MDILGKDDDKASKNERQDKKEISIDLGIGVLKFAEDELMSTKQQLDSQSITISFAKLLGDQHNEDLQDRMLQSGLIGIFGPARQGKTALAQAISSALNIPYYRILEPDEAFHAVNPDSLTITDVLRDVRHALLSDDKIVIMDSSRFINSIRDFGLTTAGTPMAYNILLTLLHNLAVRLGKTVLLVISAITNEAVHVGLLRDMIIGSCYGVIEPSIVAGGGRVSLRGGSRDFIEFKCEHPHFVSILDKNNIEPINPGLRELASPIKANRTVNVAQDAKLLSVTQEKITHEELVHLDAAAYLERHGVWPDGYMGRVSHGDTEHNETNKEKR